MIQSIEKLIKSRQELTSRAIKDIRKLESSIGSLEKGATDLDKTSRILIKIED